MAVERQGYQQILRGTSGPLAVTFFDAAGAVVDPGTVTVTITRLDGSAIVTDGATSGTGASARTRALTPAESGTLDQLTCTWTGTINGEPQTVETRAEVIGDLLFSVADARSDQGGKLASDTSYPTERIEAARAAILDAWYEICGVAFVPRVRQVVLNGNNRDVLYLPDLRVSALRAIELRSGATWSAYTDESLLDVIVEPIGRLTHETGWFPRGRQNVRITYEHGWERTPGEISQAALMLLRDRLVKGTSPERATSEVGELGTFTLATAGTQGNPWSVYREYGLPFVDAVLHRYNEKLPGAR